MKKLDLACGNNKKGADWIGVDVSKTSSVDIVHDLNIYPWPFEDNSIDEIYCSHYIEHIKHDTIHVDLLNAVNQSSNFEEFKEKLNEDSFKRSKDGFIKFMNEAYRILKPEGKMTIIAPYWSSLRSSGDPTHVRLICDSTAWYLNKEWITNNKLEHYGIDCNFDCKISYFITNEMTLKSEEVRNKAFIHDLNVIDDIIIELVKK